MNPIGMSLCTAFSASEKIGDGNIRDVAVKVKEYLKHHPQASVLIFDNQSSQQIEIDLRGSIEAV
ncbi:MAG: DUF2239 family protein, partial [Bdellovibrio sp.]